MEKVLGIIAEYNPLHNGHIYHIKKSKEETGAQYAIAIMTGNFNQRGEPSIVNKWEKTKMALESKEIDLVIELPTIYSLSSAENFASGGIKILNELGITDYISFGIENDKEENNTIKILEDIANILYKESEEYTEILKAEMKKGISYPKARENAIIGYMKDNRYSEILSGANNILAIEYLKELKRLDEIGKLKRNITPIAIKREKVNHNSANIIENYASGTEIRNLLYERKIEKIRKLVPNSSYYILKENIEKGTINTSAIIAFEKEIVYKIRTMTVEEIANLPEVTEGLEYRIKEYALNTNNICELIDSIKSKRYTQTRIQRILFYALLGINKNDMEMSKKITPYIRILGFNEKGKELLSKIDGQNIVTSVKRFEEKNTNEYLQRMIEIDKRATDVYTLMYKENSKGNLDYTMRNY